MVTKLEVNAVKSLISDKSDPKMICISADHTTMKISKDTNALLEYFLQRYRVRVNKPKLGKSAYLHILLKQFATDQAALLRLDEVDPELFTSKGVLPALQAFKRIAKRNIDPGITTISKVIISLLGYSNTRTYEVKSDFEVNGYADEEFLNDMEEQIALKKSQLKELLHKPEPSGLDDLFEPLQPSAQYIELDKDFLRREK